MDRYVLVLFCFLWNGFYCFKLSDLLCRPILLITHTGCSFFKFLDWGLCMFSSMTICLLDSRPCFSVSTDPILLFAVSPIFWYVPATSLASSFSTGRLISVTWHWRRWVALLCLSSLMTQFVSTRKLLSTSWRYVGLHCEWNYVLVCGVLVKGELSPKNICGYYDRATPEKFFWCITRLCLKPERFPKSRWKCCVTS